MTPQNQLPSRETLKAQAKRLRADMQTRGTPITHSQALESIAHQWGVRDWNTLAAQAAHQHQRWTPGQTVTGRYLGHPFKGTVKSAHLSASGFWSLSVRFDRAIDVVTSDLFSAFRRQIRATVDRTGVSPKKISDGTPHLVLDI